MSATNEAPLYKADFVDADGSLKISICITIPKEEKPRVWSCKMIIEGIGDGRARRVSGADSLQCIFNAAGFVRKCLLPLNLVEAVEGSPPEMVIPRVLPIGYGLDFNKFLEASLDLEIAKKELEISEAHKTGLGRRKKS